MRWLLGAASFFWDCLDRPTVIEKNIRAVEHFSLAIMHTTGLSFLLSGWHPSFPAKCGDHGGKQP
jgi:hypothetical protein